MILTGKEIAREVSRGDISIEPFLVEQVNPNSYNYRISDTIKEFIKMERDNPVFQEVSIPKEGFILKPHQLYLAHTFETIGSEKYAMSLIGRSSIGRLGLFLQLSANLGHTTSKHQWTLELVAAKPIKIYPHMIIGQVSFWENKGEIKQYEGKYGRLNTSQESLIYQPHDSHG